MPLLRLKFARFLIRLGKGIQSLAVTAMKPADLLAFNRLTYSRPENILSVGDEQYNLSGLSASEQDMLKHLPVRQGKLLLLGVGGGREAIALAQQGFEVTGVDFVSELVDKARQNAARAGVKIDGLVQEVSQLNVPEQSFDVLWLSVTMYSSIPTRKLRLAMLHRFAQTLKPGGHVLMQFHWDHHPQRSKRAETLKRAFAFWVRGNVDYETGDELHFNIEFLHAFSAENVIQTEMTQSGMEIVHMHVPRENEDHGWVVLLKSRGS